MEARWGGGTIEEAAEEEHVGRQVAPRKWRRGDDKHTAKKKRCAALKLLALMWMGGRALVAIQCCEIRGTCQVSRNALRLAEELCTHLLEALL